MPYENRVPDKTIQSRINQRLSSCGAGSRVHVTAVVRSGTVTLSGTLDFDYQRKPLLRAASGVNGVRLVVDHLKVKPPAHWVKEKDHGSEVQF
jgi:osmotically-inducible protein OsmY